MALQHIRTLRRDRAEFVQLARRGGGRGRRSGSLARDQARLGSRNIGFDKIVGDALRGKAGKDGGATV